MPPGGASAGESESAGKGEKGWLGERAAALLGETGQASAEEGPGLQGPRPPLPVRRPPLLPVRTSARTRYRSQLEPQSRAQPQPQPQPQSQSQSGESGQQSAVRDGPDPAPAVRAVPHGVLSAGAPAAAGLDPPGEGAAQGDSAPAEPHVLPRAAAVATARDAVRQGRARRAAAAPAAERGAAAAPAGGTSSPAASARAVRAESPRAEKPPPAASGRGGTRPAGTSASVPSRGALAGLALRERLPLWVQLRCGVEPKTLLALAVVLLVAAGFGVHHFWTGRPQAVRAPEAGSAPASSAAQGTGTGGGEDGDEAKGVAGQGAPGRRLVVDVAGKVRRPGIYRLPNGARVADALKSAGGVRPGTDISGLNRARRLVDGEQIVAGGAPAGGGTRKGVGGGSASGAGVAGSGASDAPVSLNSATAEQLETLPGVGPVLAQHILDYRDEHGGFTSIDQLQDVNGIGERRFADIKPRVSP